MPNPHSPVFARRDEVTGGEHRERINEGRVAGERVDHVSFQRPKDDVSKRKTRRDTRSHVRSLGNATHPEFAHDAKPMSVMSAIPRTTSLCPSYDRSHFAPCHSRSDLSAEPAPMLHVSRCSRSIRTMGSPVRYWSLGRVITAQTAW